MKTLTRTIAAIASVPIAGIIAMSGAGSAFALSCPAGYVTAVAANGAQFCSPTGTGGVTGGGTIVGGGGGGSYTPGTTAPIVSGGNTAPVAPAPAPVYNPPPAYVAPAPAPAPVQAPAPVALAPAPAPVPARQAVAPAAPANSAEPPSGASEIPAAVSPDTVPVSEPSKETVETPSATPSTHPSPAESSAPVNTASAIPSSSVKTPAPEVSETPVALTQASSASRLNFSVTAGAGLVAFLLLTMTVASRISFARADSNKIDDSESTSN